MQPTYGSIPGGEQQVLRSRMASRAAVCAAALAVLALVVVVCTVPRRSAAHVPRARAQERTAAHGEFEAENVKLFRV